jgi:ABC-2 type transport system ATP-binding protein
MDAIRIEGLCKRFGSIQALDQLDLTVQPGSVFGFLGPNGAGKTTTLRLLTGLARPTAGRAWVAGVEIGRGDVRRQVGYLPDVPAFYGWMTAWEYLTELIAPIFHLKAAEARARAREYLALAGLTEDARRRIGGYSRGMRQRLGVAQALMNRPSVLMLDEPVSALDPAGRHEVLELIEQLRGQVTVFFSTHILADVERVCDTVGIIHKGRLVVQAGRDELLNRYAQPVVEVEFDATSAEVQSWAAALAGNPLIDGTSVEGRVVRLAVHDPAGAKTALPGLVAQAGLALQRYQWARPSLEDVFLRLVGAE